MSRVRDMAPITDGEYINFQINMNYAINNLGYIRFNIYLDASGNTFAIDSNGAPIENRLVIEMAYTYPHIDEVTQLPVEGYTIYTFDDGSTWGEYNNQHSMYWYWLSGMYPKVIDQLT